MRTKGFVCALELVRKVLLLVPTLKKEEGGQNHDLVAWGKKIVFITCQPLTQKRSAKPAKEEECAVQ